MLLRFKTEEEWLETRKQDVTSTEVAALFGLHPYKSRLQLWHEKRGTAQSDFEETDFTRWGRRLQTAVGMGICEDQGWNGFDLTGYYARDPDARIGASFDIRAESHDRGDGLLEVKVAESFSADLGWTDDKAPIQYEFQIQTQLHLCAKFMPAIKWGCIGTLGRRQSTKVYHRLYDADLGQMIDAECRSFWQSVIDDSPPRPDYSVDSDLLEKLRKPLRTGDIINLTGNNRAHELAQTYAERRAELKTIDDLADPIRDEMARIKAELWDMIGRNEKAIIGPYTISARVQKNDEFINYGSSFRRFDFNQKKGK